MHRQNEHGVPTLLAGIVDCMAFLLLVEEGCSDLGASLK